MKRFFIGMILILSLVITSYSSVSANDDDNIKNAILGFLDASFKGDTDRILELTCVAQRNVLRLRFPPTRSSFAEVSIINVDASSVELTITKKTFTQAYITIGGDLQVSGGGQNPQPIPVADILPFTFITTVFEGGQWRVCNSGDISLRGIIEAGALGDSEFADSLLCQPLRGTVEQNPFYQMGVELGADTDFTQLTYEFVEWTTGGFVKIKSGVEGDYLRVVNVIRESGAWRICNRPETTIRMMLELAIADDFDNASSLVCPEERDNVMTDLRSLRQRAISRVNFEGQTTQPAFYESVAVLIFEAAGVERRDFRLGTNQIQYALSDQTETSANVTFNGFMIVETIGLRQNIPIAQLLPARANVTLQDGAWLYCPQSPTEEESSSDA